MMRPGSSDAKVLYDSTSESSLTQWHDYLNRYDEAIEILDKKKSKKGNLISLDKYWREEYLNTIKQRSPMKLTLSELSRIMQWKLARGKARPLQALVDSNHPDSVERLSTKAFQFIVDKNWIGAFSELVELKGIGEATASAILAPIAPELCPFMADEVIDVTCPKRDYTRKTYKILRESLIAKAEEMNRMSQHDGHIWTAEEVGKAIWVCATIAANSDGEDVEHYKKRSRNESSNLSSSKSKKSKR